MARIIEEWAYQRAGLKRNDRKLSRDLASHFELLGLSASEQPSESTITRALIEIYKRDPAHFAAQRHGRQGRRLHMLQKGSLEAERPLQYVVIDHTPGDARCFSIEGKDVIIRPTLTTASDVFTGVYLAGFLSRFPPSRQTVALAMAMITTDKTSMLRSYLVPGEWECAGVPECIMVDGAAEFANDTFKWSCDRYSIDLEIGLPGLPEARSRHERSFRTLNSDIHEWPGATLSNPQELKAHGGERPAELSFEEAQRRLLLAIMEFNNETFSGMEPPRIFKWRQYVKAHPARRFETLDQRNTFIDFLPHKFAKLQVSGIQFENCWFRSGDLAKPLFENTRQVRFHWDPRDTTEIYVSIADGPYLTIPRATRRHAPRDLYELRLYNKGLREKANEAKDSLLLAQIRAAKKADVSGYLRHMSDDFAPERLRLPPPDPTPTLDLSDFAPKRLDVDPPVRVNEPPPAPGPGDRPSPGFEVPEFPTRLK